MKSCDITVVIPVFNRYDSFKKSIESVLAQTESCGEIIVIDDGSDIEISSKIKQLCLDAGVSYLFNQINMGVSYSRNRGINHASKDYIALLDSDDLWDINKIKFQVEFMNLNPSLRIMQSEERWIRNGKPLKPKKHHKKPSGDIWQRSLDLCLVSPSAVLIEKKLLRQVGLFDECMRSCEDYDLWLRISRWHDIGLDPRVSVTKIGGHSDQLSAAYERIDEFRVYSLLKNMLGECSVGRYQALKDKVLEKIAVLKNGAIKRKIPVNELIEAENNIKKDRIIPVLDIYKNLILSKA